MQIDDSSIKWRLFLVVVYVEGGAAAPCMRRSFAQPSRQGYPIFYWEKLYGARLLFRDYDETGAAAFVSRLPFDVKYTSVTSFGLISCFKVRSWTVIAG